MQFTVLLDTNNVTSTNISTNVVYFFRVVPHPHISSLSVSLSRFSIYVRLFGMLDIHILRSPQIYHNNPSISESEYRSTYIRRIKKSRERKWWHHIFICWELCHKISPKMFRSSPPATALVINYLNLNYWMKITHSNGIRSSQISLI